MRIILTAHIVMALLVLSIGCGTPEVGLISTGLRPCPDSPNCVTSQNGDKDHAILPIAYPSSRTAAYDKMKRIIMQQSNATIVREEENYMQVTFRTKIMRFVDDVEFWFPENEPVIHMRSASRLGHSDLGVNRKRMAHIRGLFTAQAEPPKP
jgi:uncharacterized protein (DUF1499 family)